MDAAGVLNDAFDRIAELVGSTVDGLSEAQLARQPDGSGNPIGWLVWHLTRVQDDHLAGASGEQQVWDDGWRERFGLELSPHDIGYGADESQVAAVRVSAEDLIGYHRAVSERTHAFVGGLDAGALDRVVDENWDPPVTLGVRLVSVVSDCLQHLGQAAYVRGLFDL